MPSTDKVDVIVQYTESTGAAPRRSSLEGAINLGHGGRFNRALDLVHAGHYTVTAADLQDLASNPDVAFANCGRHLTLLTPTAQASTRSTTPG